MLPEPLWVVRESIQIDVGAQLFLLVILSHSTAACRACTRAHCSWTSRWCGTGAGEWEVAATGPTSTATLHPSMGLAEASPTSRQWRGSPRKSHPHPWRSMQCHLHIYLQPRLHRTLSSESSSHTVSTVSSLFTLLQGILKDFQYFKKRLKYGFTMEPKLLYDSLILW